MKKIKILALLCACVLLLTSCVRSDLNIKVNKNGTVDIKYLYAIEEFLLYSDSKSDSSNKPTLTDEEIEEYKNLGFDYEEYTDGDYSGYILSIQNVNPVNGVNLPTSDDLNFSYTKEGFLYKIDIDLSQSKNISTLNEYGEAIQETNGSALISIELPVDPISHNATSVSEDGRTLTWDILTMDTSSPIHLEFKLVPSWLVPVLCIAILAVIILAVLLLKKRNKIVSNVELPLAEVKEICMEDADSEQKD